MKAEEGASPGVPKRQARPGETPIDDSSVEPLVDSESSWHLPVTWAMAYAEAGWWVLPLRPLTNRPHPMLGSGWDRSSVGSRSEEQIRSWWQHDPAANIGIVPARSRVLVLDLDCKPGGANGMDSLVEWMSGDWLPEAPMVTTPTGGRHLYFGLPPGAPALRSGEWLPGVDVPWQVPVPPSARMMPVRPGLSEHQQREGAEVQVSYVWSADTRHLPVAPDHLLADIRTRRGQPSSGTGARASGDLPATETFREDGLRAGQRNNDLHRLACRLWRTHWPHDDLVLRIAYEVWCATDQTDFPWAEALRVLDSARRFVEPQVRRERAWAQELEKYL